MSDQFYGKVIVGVDGLHEGSGEVAIHFEDGSTFHMWHSQDCCESVSINDIDVSFSSLDGAIWYECEVSSNYATPLTVTKSGPSTPSALSVGTLGFAGTENRMATTALMFPPSIVSRVRAVDIGDNTPKVCPLCGVEEPAPWWTMDMNPTIRETAKHYVFPVRIYHPSLWHAIAAWGNQEGLEIGN